MVGSKQNSLYEALVQNNEEGARFALMDRATDEIPYKSMVLIDPFLWLGVSDINDFSRMIDGNIRNEFQQE